MTAVVVFVHIHYPDTWAPIRDRLGHCMTVPYRIILTTTANPDLFDRPASATLTDMQVVTTENRGRDVLPFLQALRLAGEFDIGLKLHGKKSVHRLDGEAWRDALLHSLLPPPPETERLVDRMRRDPRIVMTVPRKSLCSIEPHVGRNMASMRRIARHLRLELRKSIATTPYFTAGTMFWFRRDALEPLTTVDFQADFQPERRQTDGTAAHAFERLFAVVAERNGGVTVPADILGSAASAEDQAEIRSLVRREVDSDTAHVRRPGKLGAFALRYLWFVTPVYASLPEPVRRRIKAALGRGAER